MRLLHENEHSIYGDSPERVRRLFERGAVRAFRAVYDAANYVFCGYDPWEGWEKTKDVHGPFPHQGLDGRRRSTAAWPARGRGASPT